MDTCTLRDHDTRRVSRRTRDTRQAIWSTYFFSGPSSIYLAKAKPHVGILLLHYLVDPLGLGSESQLHLSLDTLLSPPWTT